MTSFCPEVAAIFTVLMASVLAGCLSSENKGPEETSPYVDQWDSEVRGLSAEEIDDLRQGKGMGLARPAELNGYPGPLHVLELADALGLSQEQVDAVQAIRIEMLDDARPLGEKIVAQHEALELAFRSGSIDPVTLRALIDDLDALYADLRYVHLAAHLDTLPLLTAAQLHDYMTLRGYPTGEGGHGGHHG